MSAGALTVEVPDIGDFDEVPVIEIHVAPGDQIALEDPLVTLESDKATMGRAGAGGGGRRGGSRRGWATRLSREQR